MTTNSIERATTTSPPRVSDEFLIQQFVQGDLRAFDSLYNRHVKAVFNRVRFVVPEMDVEDVTQEVFLALLGSLPTFRGESQFGTWLRALTNHKIAEYYRRRSRKKESIQVDFLLAEQKIEESYVVSYEDRIVLYNALKTLPTSYFEVILLRFAEGMQFNEIANHLERHPEAIKSLFRRAISALREIMEETDEKTSNQ